MCGAIKIRCPPFSVSDNVCNLSFKGLRLSMNHYNDAVSLQLISKWAGLFSELLRTSDLRTSFGYLRPVKKEPPIDRCCVPPLCSGILSNIGASYDIAKNQNTLTHVCMSYTLCISLFSRCNYGDIWMLPGHNTWAPQTNVPYFSDH